MKSQTLKIALGPVQLRLSVGDEDANGCIDLTLRVRVVGLFELPPIRQNIDAKLAQDAIDGARALEKALAPKKA